MKQLSIDIRVAGKETLARVVTDTYRATEQDLDTFCRGVVRYLKSEWTSDNEQDITVYPVNPKGRSITVL